MLLRNGDGFRAAHFAFVGENVGEVNRYRFGLMAATISSRVSTSTSFAPVCRIWWSNGWRWLLDDDFISGEIANIWNREHARFEVFGHHAA